ncbi:hypothetical protein N9018_02825 [Rhodopirellula sp.]|nr:hypothetical protein [Rhodopirellula sp.]
MSETVQDLRSPLAGVRDSMRRIRDGGAGETTSEQFCSLTSPMDQCDSMFQAIDDMVQWERLRTGIPCVDR